MAITQNQKNQYDRAIRAADRAIQDRKYADAIKYLAVASKIRPNSMLVSERTAAIAKELEEEKIEHPMVEGLAAVEGQWV